MIRYRFEAVLPKCEYKELMKRRNLVTPACPDEVKCGFNFAICEYDNNTHKPEIMCPYYRRLIEKETMSREEVIKAIKEYLKLAGTMSNDKLAARLLDGLLDECAFEDFTTVEKKMKKNEEK